MLPGALTRTYLKKVFWPHLGVGAFFQVLDNQQVALQEHFLRGACGLKISAALTWNQNPNFETG
jgi:hypothetical protein